MSHLDLDDDVDILSGLDPSTLLARVRMVAATETLCRAWAGAIIEGVGVSTFKDTMRPEVAEFARAWEALAVHESPQSTVDTSVTAMAAVNGVKAPQVREMLMTELIGSVTILCASAHSPAWFKPVHKALMRLRCAVDRTGADTEVRRQVVEDELQRAAEHGAGEAEIRSTLDAWVEVFGYPTIELKPRSASSPRSHETPEMHSM